MVLEVVEAHQMEVTRMVWSNRDTSSNSQHLLLHKLLVCFHTLHTFCWGCCRNGTGQRMWRSQPTASWIFTLAPNWVCHTHTTVLLSLHTLYGLCSHTCAAVTGHVIAWKTLCTVGSHICSHSTTWRVWGEGAELLIPHFSWSLSPIKLIPSAGVQLKPPNTYQNMENANIY